MMFNKIRAKSDLFISPQTQSVYKIIFKYRGAVLCFRQIQDNPSSFRIRINSKNPKILYGVKNNIINYGSWSEFKSKDHFSIEINKKDFPSVIADSMFAITKYFSETEKNN